MTSRLATGKTPDGAASDGVVSVSVVIPARNEEHYVEGSLRSVAAQEYPLERVECIVVDNGSSDGTARKVQEYASQHPELALSVVPEGTAGVAAAKNSGARAARGEVLVFLDADSSMERPLIADIVAQYRAGDPAGCVRIVADSDDFLDRAFFWVMELGKILFGIRTSMMYCRRSLFWEVGGFRQELRVAEDLDLLSRVQDHLKRNGGGQVSYITSSSILTSPRRLHQMPLRLGLVTVFVRWALAFANIGRGRRY